MKNSSELTDGKLQYLSQLSKRLDALKDTLDSTIINIENDLDNIAGRSTCWSLETFSKLTSEEKNNPEYDQVGGHLYLTLGEVNNQQEGPEIIIELSEEQVEEILSTLKPKESSTSRTDKAGWYGPDSWVDNLKVIKR